MNLPKNLTDKGFTISAVSASDLNDYTLVKKHCYKAYVDEYYNGNWSDERQTDEFWHNMKFTCFMKISLHSETVGFFAFDEQEDKIGGITIQITKEARNHGLGSFYLKEIVSVSDASNKPIFLKVFKSNPAQNLYKRFGFTVYDETATHYLMKYSK